MRASRWVFWAPVPYPGSALSWLDVSVTFTEFSDVKHEVSAKSQHMRMFAAFLAVKLALCHARFPRRRHGSALPDGRHCTQTS